MAVSEAAGALSDELGQPRPSPRSPSASSCEEDEVSEALQAERGASHAVAGGAEKRRTIRVPADLRDAWRAEPGYDAVEAQLAAEDAPLDERERPCSALRFEEDLNQYEIGRRLGVSQMQVSRIMRRALRKLLAAVQGTRSDELLASRSSVS